MTWDSLYDDLAARFDFERRRQLHDEANERCRAEVGAIGLLDRLRPGAPDPVTCRLRNGDVATGAVGERGDTWVTLDSLPLSRLVPIAAIETIGGIRVAGLAPRTAAELATPISVPLRSIARTGRAAWFDLDRARHRALITAVGADHVIVTDAASGEPTAIGYEALVSVRYRP